MLPSYLLHCCPDLVFVLQEVPQVLVLPVRCPNRHSLCRHAFLLQTVKLLVGQLLGVFRGAGGLQGLEGQLRGLLRDAE
jgi:hypothetical protein